MITLDILVTQPGVPPRDELEHWIAQAWVMPARDGQTWVFADIDVARIHLIRQLQEDMEVNEAAVPVVLSLLDQLYAARRQMRALSGALRANAPPALLGELHAWLEQS